MDKKKKLAEGGYAIEPLPAETLKRQPWGRYIHPNDGSIVVLPTDDRTKSHLLSKGFKVFEERRKP